VLPVLQQFAVQLNHNIVGTLEFAQKDFSVKSMQRWGSGPTTVQTAVNLSKNPASISTISAGAAVPVPKPYLERSALSFGYLSFAVIHSGGLRTSGSRKTILVATSPHHFVGWGYDLRIRASRHGTRICPGATTSKSSRCERAG
jgi:hypothetical protein